MESSSLIVIAILVLVVVGGAVAAILLLPGKDDGGTPSPPTPPPPTPSPPTPSPSSYTCWDNIAPAIVDCFDKENKDAIKKCLTDNSKTPQMCVCHTYDKNFHPFDTEFPSCGASVIQSVKQMKKCLNEQCDPARTPEDQGFTCADAIAPAIQRCGQFDGQWVECIAKDVLGADGTDGSGACECGNRQSKGDDYFLTCWNNSCIDDNKTPKCYIDCLNKGCTPRPEPQPSS